VQRSAALRGARENAARRRAKRGGHQGARRPLEWNYDPSDRMSRSRGRHRLSPRPPLVAGGRDAASGTLIVCASRRARTRASIQEERVERNTGTDVVRLERRPSFALPAWFRRACECAGGAVVLARSRGSGARGNVKPTLARRCRSSAPTDRPRSAESHSSGWISRTLDQISRTFGRRTRAASATGAATVRPNGPSRTATPTSPRQSHDSRTAIV
jgi:hypothetical protein